jgi:hypothetical protein
MHRDIGHGEYAKIGIPRPEEAEAGYDREAVIR